MSPHVNRKSSKRMENKKKKLAALLEISKLNEDDRSKRLAEAAEPNHKRFKNSEDLSRMEPTPPSQNVPITKKPKLEGAELNELKRMLRERTSKLRQVPNFRLRDIGIQATIDTDLEQRVPIFLSDIQHLVMYSQLGHHAPYAPSRWCALDKFNRLNSTCLLIVENVSLQDYIDNEDDCSFLQSQFEHKLEVLAHHDPSRMNIVKNLSMVPLTSTQLRKILHDYGSLETAVIKSIEVFDSVQTLFPIETANDTIQIAVNGLPMADKFPRTLLLLSGWQMVEENFPLPIKGLMEHKYYDYVLTKDRYDNVTPFSPMFGVDCEMCMTTIGDLELTRVSVVNEKLQPIYDTLVKPDNKITDYLTRFSGITKKMMLNVTKKLSDVQEDLRKLLPADAILVGQSLGNDMHALKMMHPYIIDTSIIFNITGERSRKTKLKTLMAEFLSEKIQEGNAGHCSTEDSMAALKLVQLKLQRSLYFGDAVMGDNIDTEIRIAPELGTFNYATSLLKQATRIDKTAMVIGMDTVCEQYQYYVDKGLKLKEDKNIKCVKVNSCNDVIEKICESLNNYSLNIGHMVMNDKQLKNGMIFRRIDKWCQQVFESLIAPGLVIVLFTGRGGHNGCCFIKTKKSMSCTNVE